MAAQEPSYSGSTILTEASADAIQEKTQTQQDMPLGTDKLPECFSLAPIHEGTACKMSCAKDRPQSRCAEVPTASGPHMIEAESYTPIICLVDHLKPGCPITETQEVVCCTRKAGANPSADYKNFCEA